MSSQQSDETRRLTSASELLQSCGIQIGANFHALKSEQVDALLELAKFYRYRKPKNATGSRARCYHARLQRLASFERES